MASDWRTGLSHSERMEKVLEGENGIKHDVLFVVGPQKAEVPAHKLILRIHSKYFDELAPSLNPKSPEIITLEEDSPEEFKWFLKFLYTGKFDVEARALPLLKYSVQFNVEDLLQCCVSTLETSFTTSSVVGIYEDACKYNQNELKQKSLEFIWSNAHEILDSDEFLKFTNHNLFKVLASDDLAATNETQVFKAVLRWAKEQCKRYGQIEYATNLRNLMTDLIPLIRFPVMNKSEFSLLVAPSKILTSEELISILLYFNVDVEQRSQMPPGLFNPLERKWYTITSDWKHTEYIMNRLVFPKGNYISLGRPQRMRQAEIKFRVNRDIQILSVMLNHVEIDCYAGIASNSDITFDLKIIQVENAFIMNKCTKTFQLRDLIVVPMRIEFPPAKYDVLQPNILYKMTIAVTKGMYFPFVFVPPNDNPEGKIFKVNGGGKSVVFQFENEDNSDDEVFGNGLISEIGFKFNS